MKTWVLVYDYHYAEYLTKNKLERTTESFQQFLKEIGTIAVFFHKPSLKSSNSTYCEAPEGTCIRLRHPEKYVSVIHEKLVPSSLDKSGRRSSCTIV